MGLDSKIGAGIILFAGFLYFILIPVGIQEASVEWKGGIGVLKTASLSARLFPRILAITVGVLGTLLFFSDLYRKAGRRPEVAIASRTWIVMLVLVCYFGIIFVVGYLYATLLALCLLMYCFGMHRIWRILMVSVLGTGAIYLIFQKLLYIQLPKGWLIDFPL
jgi:hypothetical protein